MSIRERRPIVGVMGSGSRPCSAQALALGQALADWGVHLLTGGGGGVMASVSEAFFHVKSRKGMVLGVLPGEEKNGLVISRAGYPNPWVEIPVQTHLPLSGNRGEEINSRNHINVLSSDAVIVLPGGAGTLSEVKLALRYQKPVVAFLPANEEFSEIQGMIPVVFSISEVRLFLEQVLEDPFPAWKTR